MLERLEIPKQKKLDPVPPGAYCDHRRMKFVSCEPCKERKIACAVECPDCKLYWMLHEGTLG